MGGAIPGLYLAKGPEAKEWASCPSEVKRRHFVLDGQKLKLFGKRGKTYKGVINLLDVEALRPTTDATAPLGSLELQLRGSRSQATLVCIMAPDHSIDDLFMALGNAVPSHATSDDLWRLRMGSRPAPNAGSTHEYRIGKTLGSGTFGKVKLAQRVPDGKLFAIKCLNRSRIVMATQSGRLAKEIRLLKLLNHPNVIRLHEVLHTQAEIMMVMECAIHIYTNPNPDPPDVHRGQGCFLMHSRSPCPRSPALPGTSTAATYSTCSTRSRASGRRRCGTPYGRCEP